MYHCVNGENICQQNLASTSITLLKCTLHSGLAQYWPTDNNYKLQFLQPANWDLRPDPTCTLTEPTYNCGTENCIHNIRSQLQSTSDHGQTETTLRSSVRRPNILTAADLQANPDNPIFAHLYKAYKPTAINSTTAPKAGNCPNYECRYYLCADLDLENAWRTDQHSFIVLNAFSIVLYILFFNDFYFLLTPENRHSPKPTSGR